jgi:creatinine amidohydrolase
VADDGIGSGDPSLSSARAGQIFTRFLIGHVADFLRHFQKSDPRRPDLAPGASK